MLHGNAKFEMILQLCQGASSAAPVQCYDKLESVGSTLKTKFGLDLCARADSTLPGECFSEVSAFSGTNNKVKPEVLSEFCRSLEDRAPLLCVHAVKETGMAALPQAIEVCSEVVGSGGKAGSRGNTAAADCIRAMQSQVSALWPGVHPYASVLTVYGCGPLYRSTSAPWTSGHCSLSYHLPTPHPLP
jgi:hypothetical protein